MRIEINGMEESCAVISLHSIKEEVLSYIIHAFYEKVFFCAVMKLSYSMFAHVHWYKLQKPYTLEMIINLSTQHRLNC